MWLLKVLLPVMALVLSGGILIEHVVTHPITLSAFSPGLHYEK